MLNVGNLFFSLSLFPQLVFLERVKPAELTDFLDGFKVCRRQCLSIPTGNEFKYINPAKNTKSGIMILNQCTAAKL